jgi:hypothetical protein
VQKAVRQHEDAPGSAVAEDAADFALKLCRATSELRAELAGKRAQAFIADIKADFGDGTLRSKQGAGAVHAQAGEELMRSFAEGRAKQAMEMEIGKAGFAGGFGKTDPGLVIRREQIASAAEAAEGVVMKKRRHGEMILPAAGRRRQ